MDNTGHDFSKTSTFDYYLPKELIAQDPVEADAIWITEVWTDAASHTASLSLPAVQQAIAKARPLIAGFDSHVETIPVGGHGVPSSL